MNTPSSSRYRVFSTEKFRDASVSKFWSCFTFAGSCTLIPLRHYRSYFELSVENVLNGHQLWKLVTSRLFFLQLKDIIAGSLLIYSMRHIERRFKSRKFCDFIILTGITAWVIEIIIHCACRKYFNVTLMNSPYFACGPYALLFSCFVQFFLDVPFVPYAHVFGVPLSVKNLPVLFAIQLLLSPLEIVISCCAGMIAGLLYKMNFLKMQSLSLIPNCIFNAFNCVFDVFTQLGEDKTGRLLPIGATLEAQRQDYYDRYEQRLIYRQIQQQHLSNSTTEPLFAARRWFGAGGGATNEVRPSEEKVRTLVEMGFEDRTRVEQVLRNTNNDLNSAAHILLQQPTSS